MPGQGPHAGGALVLCGLALACGAAHAQHPWAPVRNVAPQRSANTLREQRPIHCPRSVREPGEGTGSETDALLREFFERHTTMDYEEAAVVARRLLEVSPDRGQAYYNLACVLGRLHRPEEALAALEAAVEHGWRDIVHLSMDPDLAVVRGSERYRRLVAGLGRLLQREQAARSAELAGEVPRILAQYEVPAATMATAGPGGARLASFGPAGPLPEAAVGTVEGEACLRVMAVGALVLHGEPGRPAEAIVHLAGADDGPAPAYRLNVVSRVEAATSEPFLLCCRRHVIEPLGLSASAVSPGPPLTTQPDARSTVADLARLLSAISPTGRAEATEVVRLALDLGFEAAGGDPAILELSGPFVTGTTDIVVRWQPLTGRVAVVATPGGSGGGRAARRIAGLALAGHFDEPREIPARGDVN